MHAQSLLLSVYVSVERSFISKLSSFQLHSFMQCNVQALSTTEGFTGRGNLHWQWRANQVWIVLDSMFCAQWLPWIRTGSTLIHTKTWNSSQCVSIKWQFIQQKQMSSFSLQSLQTGFILDINCHSVWLPYTECRCLKIVICRAKWTGFNELNWWEKVSWSRGNKDRMGLVEWNLDLWSSS